MADLTATELSAWGDWLGASDREVLGHLLADAGWRRQVDEMVQPRAPRLLGPQAGGAAPVPPAANPSPDDASPDSLAFVRHHLQQAGREGKRYRKLLDEVLAGPSTTDASRAADLERPEGDLL